MRIKLPTAKAESATPASNYPAHWPSLMDLVAVKRETGMSHDKIYSLMRDGQFPVAVRVGARSSAWYAEEVWAWRCALPRVTEVEAV